jgi:hypothetical protein
MEGPEPSVAETAASLAVRSLQVTLAARLSSGQRSPPETKDILSDENYVDTLPRLASAAAANMPRACSPLLAELLSWLPPGWSGANGIGAENHSAWRGRLDETLVPAGIVEAVVADALGMTMVAKSGHRLNSAIVLQLVAAALHFCTGGTALMFGGLPLLASSRWDSCFALLSEVDFVGTCAAISHRLSAAATHAMHELAAVCRLVGLITVDATRLSKSPTGNEIGYVYEILSAQCTLLDRKNISDQLRCIQFHGIYKFVQQLDFEVLMQDHYVSPDSGGGNVGLDDLERLVSGNLLGQAEWHAQNWNPIHADPAGQLLHADNYDVRYCANGVATAIITAASRAVFEKRGVGHLSSLLRAIRESASANQPGEMRKAVLLLWRMLQGANSVYNSRCKESPSGQAEAARHEVEQPHESDFKAGFPWALIRNDVLLHTASAAQLGPASELVPGWAASTTLPIPRQIQPVFGSVMRRRDKSSHWLMMVATGLANHASVVRSDAAQLEDLEVTAAVMVQVAAHDLHGFNDLILGSIFDVGSVHRPAGATDALSNWLLGVACVRVLVDPGSGFSARARQTPHYESGTYSFETQMRLICTTFLTNAEGILRNCFDRDKSRGALQPEKAVQLPDLLDQRAADPGWWAIEDAVISQRVQHGDADHKYERIDQVLLPATIITLMHTLRFVSEALHNSVVEIESECQMLVKQITLNSSGLLWNLVTHVRRDVALNSCKLLIASVGVRPDVHVHVLLAGLHDLRAQHMESTAEQQALLSTLIACIGAWTQSVQRLDMTARIALFQDLRSDKVMLECIHLADAIAMVLVCSAQASVRVLSLHFADQMSSLQQLFLEPAMAHKAAVAAMQQRQWASTPCSDAKWGTGHASLGMVMISFGQSIVSKCAPDFASKFERKARVSGSFAKIHNFGTLMLAGIASQPQPRLWAACLAGLGKTIPAGACSKISEQIFSQMLEIVGKLAQLPSSDAVMKANPKLYDDDFFELWKNAHVILLSVAAPSQQQDGLALYLGSQWGYFLKTELVDIRTSVVDVMVATNWQNIHTLVKSLLDWWKVHRNAELCPMVLEILRVVAQEEGFTRACDETPELLQAYMKIICLGDNGLFHLQFPKTSGGDYCLHWAGSSDAYSNTPVHFYIDFAQIVIRAMAGLCQIPPSDPLSRWALSEFPLKSRYAIFLHLQKWSGEPLNPQGDEPVATWAWHQLDEMASSQGIAREVQQQEVEDWLHMLQHLALVGIEAMIKCGPLFASIGERSLSAILEWIIRVEPRGHRILRWFLHHHYDQVINSCLDMCYSSRRETDVAMYAICCNFMKAPVEPAIEEEIASMQARLNARIMDKTIGRRTVSDAILRDGMFGHRVHRSAPQIIFLALGQLLSPVFTVRINAFDLLCHVVPFCERLGDQRRTEILSDHTSKPDNGQFAKFMDALRIGFMADTVDYKRAVLISVEVSNRCAILTEKIMGEAFKRLSGQIADHVNKSWMWELLAPWCKTIRLSGAISSGCL